MQDQQVQNLISNFHSSTKTKLKQLNDEGVNRIESVRQITDNLCNQNKKKVGVSQINDYEIVLKMYQQIKELRSNGQDTAGIINELILRLHQNQQGALIMTGKRAAFDSFFDDNSDQSKKFRYADFMDINQLNKYGHFDL